MGREVVMPTYRVHYWVAHKRSTVLLPAKDADAARKAFPAVQERLRGLYRGCRNFELRTERGQLLAGEDAATRKWKGNPQGKLDLQKE